MQMIVSSGRISADDQLQSLSVALNPQNMITPMVSGGTLGFTLGTGRPRYCREVRRCKRSSSTILETVNVFRLPGARRQWQCARSWSDWRLLEIFPGGSWIFTGNGAGGVWLAAAASCRRGADRGTEPNAMMRILGFLALLDCWLAER